MILQALADYYDRLADDPSSGIAPPGFSMQKISFCLVLDATGGLVDVQDLRDTSGKKPAPRLLRVPEPPKRSVGIAANFLWDKTDYVLGAARPDPKKPAKPERIAACFAAFRSRAHEIGDGVEDEGMRAVLGFLDHWDPARASSLPYWDELAGQNLVFRLDGAREYVHERPAVGAAWLATRAGVEAPIGTCLVRGRRGPIARLHQDIKGVLGSQAKGGSLVSFNADAFESYGKEQSFNSPVSIDVAFAYTTALNRLLEKGSRQRIQIGDATTVFWAERASPVEDLLAGLLAPPADEEGKDGQEEAAQAVTKRVREVLEAVRRGEQAPGIDPAVRFYILGLSPNNARLAVRFWHAGMVGELLARLGQHFSDLAIERRERDPEYPPIWMLLREAAAQRKSENIPPALEAPLMRALLTGSAYPAALFSAILGRIRADKSVNYLRAALIKACLVRRARLLTSHQTEITMSLNTENSSPAYLLGRLFAVLEKAQKEAVPGAESTIKDRYFGAASATPRSVFPQLLRLAQHHIQKAEWGHASDRRIAEILDRLDSFPTHLSLEQQGLFALGYYQQRNALYTARQEKEIQS